jgi:hypothetical protein
MLAISSLVGVGPEFLTMVACRPATLASLNSGVADQPTRFLSLPHLIPADRPPPHAHEPHFILFSLWNQSTPQPPASSPPPLLERSPPPDPLARRLWFPLLRRSEPRLLTLCCAPPRAAPSVLHLLRLPPGLRLCAEDGCRRAACLHVHSRRGAPPILLEPEGTARGGSPTQWVVVGGCAVPSMSPAQLL